MGRGSLSEGKGRVAAASDSVVFRHVDRTANKEVGNVKMGTLRLC